MKKVLLFVMVVALMGGILYMSGALPQEVVDAVVSHASATADKPVDAAVTLLARIRQTAGKDRASFEQLFRNTPDEVMDEYYTYDWSAYAPHHHSDTAHILAARQGQYAYVSLVFYTTSGNHPNTNRSSDFIALPLSLQGDQWLIEGSEQADAALQDALYALYPAPVVEAFHAKRNASLLAGGNFMYINPTSVYTGHSNVEVKHAWQNEDGSVGLTVWIANGTRVNIAYGKASITLKDQKLGNIIKLSNVAIDEVVPAGTSRMVEISIPRNKVRTGTKTWSNINSKITVNTR